jgi:hypothetical protein
MDCTEACTPLTLYKPGENHTPNHDEGMATHIINKNNKQ